jgi:hypothetical protein
MTTVTYPAESTPEIDAFIAGYVQRAARRRRSRLPYLTPGARRRLALDWQEACIEARRFPQERASRAIVARARGEAFCLTDVQRFRTYA